MKEYAVIFEQTSTGWSDYVPGLDGLGDPVPEPTTRVLRMPISA